MCCLDPATAIQVAVDGKFVDQLEHGIRCIIRKYQQAIAAFGTQYLPDLPGITLEPRCDNAIVPTRRTPTDFRSLENGNTDTFLCQR